MYTFQDLSPTVWTSWCIYERSKRLKVQIARNFNQTNEDNHTSQNENDVRSILMNFYGKYANFHQKVTYIPCNDAVSLSETKLN